MTRATAIDGGEVIFLGQVTDEGPRWTWQLATSQQDWTVDVSEAIVNAGLLTFRPGKGQSLPFLEGRLYRVAERGGPGYSPQIQFSSQGQPFKLPEGGRTTDNRFHSAVPAINPQNGDIIGQLKFTVEQGMVASFGHQDDPGIVLPAGMSILGGNTVSVAGSPVMSPFLSGRLSTLLQMVQGFSGEMSSASNNQIIPQNILMSDRVTNIAAAYASVLSDFELVLPKDNFPGQWQAKLGVTVTIQ